MSQIKPFLAIALMIVAVVASGCGDKRATTGFSADTGKHQAKWLENHWVEAQKDLSACQSCHGSNLLGGIAPVSCFSANRGAQTCHAGGPLGANAGHGVGWEHPSQHGRKGAMATPDPYSAGFAYCTQCHGASFSGGAGKATSCKSCHAKAPHPNKPWRGTTTSGTSHVFADPKNADQCNICHQNGTNSDLKPTTPASAGTAPGCFNSTMCHGNSTHSDNWKNNPASTQFHKNAVSSISSCTICHGVNYDGVGGTAPSCGNANSQNGLKCHSNGAPINQKAANCSSCHGTPPDASAFPNTQKSHSAHSDLQGVTCNACHKGGGTGTANHAKGTPFLSFSSGFRAKKAGTADPAHTKAAGAVTCSNISCHGGNVTPIWGGSVKPACTDCHEQGSSQFEPEYNSFYSGGHKFHLAVFEKTNYVGFYPAPGFDYKSLNFSCTSCHNVDELNKKQQHFSGLVTHSFSQSSGKTVGGGTTKLSYDNTKPISCSAVQCHPNGFSANWLTSTYPDVN